MNHGRVVSRAPGRVNLIGEHTDYNDGFVLPMALPFSTEIEWTRVPGRDVVIESVGFDPVSFSLDDDPADVASWGKYISGMASLLAADGVQVDGFRASVRTDVPIGAALSSSAALEVAAGFGLCGLAGVEPDPVYIAKIGQRVENEIIGVNSGILDQLISATATPGSLTLIDCRSLDTTAIGVPDRCNVVIMDTMTRRELVDTEYDLRRAACERAAAQLGVAALRDATLDDISRVSDPVDHKRARHVVTENQRVHDVIEALAVDDLARVGELMNESHRSLSVDYEVSSLALDQMSAFAREESGCFGARMTGGGFAGSAVALVERDATESFVASVQQRWNDAHGLVPDLWAVAPSAGASVRVLEG